MFRTILVHLQEQLYKLYIAFGICRYVCLLCGYNHTTATRLAVYKLLIILTAIVLGKHCSPISTQAGI